MKIIKSMVFVFGALAMTSHAASSVKPISDIDTNIKCTKIFCDALRSDDVVRVRAVWEQLPLAYKTQMRTTDRGLLWILTASCKNPLIWHQLKRWGFDRRHAFSEEGKNSLMQVVAMKDEPGAHAKDLYMRCRAAKTLLTCGVSVDAQSPVDGKTALMVAVEGGELGMAFFLLQHAADPLLKDRSNNTVLHYAQEYLGRATTDHQREVGNALVSLLKRQQSDRK